MTTPENHGYRASSKEVDSRIKGKAVDIEIGYTELDNFVFPIIETICKPRGMKSDQISEIFSAACPSCGSGINADVLAMQAAMIMSIGKPQISSCAQCTSKTIKAQLHGLSGDELLALTKDKFFSQLAELNQK